MFFGKREFLLPNIKRICQKEKGQVTWTYGLFMISFLAIYLFAAFRLERFRTASAYLEDALAASNLASAIVDIEEFGISRKVIIADASAAYAMYLKAIKGNLNLDDFWCAKEGGVISGRIRVIKYIIYNVMDGRVSCISFDENGVKQEKELSVEHAQAPNGKRIESASVYSEISFMVEVFPGRYVEAHKGNLVDVVQ